MDKKRIIMVLIPAILVIIVGWILVHFILQTGPYFGSGGELFPIKNCAGPFFPVKVILSTLNIILVLPLLYMYIRTYQELRNPFTLGLIFVMVSLFFFTITTNPLVFMFFDIPGVYPNPFAILPDMFCTLALIVLIRISQI
jgi:hypothetical protein